MASNPPTKEEFIATRLAWAQAQAAAEWEIRYGRPQRAKENAEAWVGLVTFPTFSVENYCQAANVQVGGPVAKVMPATSEYYDFGDFSATVVGETVHLHVRHLGGEMKEYELPIDGSEMEVQPANAVLVAAFKAELDARDWVMNCKNAYLLKRILD